MSNQTDLYRPSPGDIVERYNPGELWIVCDIRTIESNNSFIIFGISIATLKSAVFFSNSKITLYERYESELEEV